MFVGVTFTTFLLSIVFKPNRLPYKDIKTLIPAIISLNLILKDDIKNGLDENEVWLILVDIIANEIGIDREKIQKSASIVNDLGIG
ncbi:MAG: hypothetical protein COB02_15150 [Candidatus Cloacimonadota bacterium]|nr:MAG: hypothetical protein COB02_15150 [Candidatus Cloacimonadota bacterium]